MLIAHVTPVDFRRHGTAFIEITVLVPRRFQTQFQTEFPFLKVMAKTVKYEASTLWNQSPSSLKEFSHVQYFSDKLNLQTADIVTLHSTV